MASCHREPYIETVTVSCLYQLSWLVSDLPPNNFTVRAERARAPARRHPTCIEVLARRSGRVERTRSERASIDIGVLARRSGRVERMRSERASIDIGVLARRSGRVECTRSERASIDIGARRSI